MKSKFKYSFWQGPVGVRFATVWLRWHKISRPKGEESGEKQNKSNTLLQIFLSLVQDRMASELPSLAGKVCIVTGASRGIGKGIALMLAKAGATVYITGK